MDISRVVARMLVVYYRRPGGQMQHSSPLELDPGSDRIRTALHFARKHLSRPLSVEELAGAANMSLRQFSRAFLAGTGMTPAKAVERLRVKSARPRVEDGNESFDEIARAVGFADAERMRQSFVRVLGQTPRLLRQALQKARAQSSANSAKEP